MLELTPREATIRNVKEPPAGLKRLAWQQRVLPVLVLVCFVTDGTLKKTTYRLFVPMSFRLVLSN